MIRAFVALPLPDDLQDALEALQQGLPVGRSTGRDTFHLTLAFVGEHPPELIESLHEQLRAIRASGFDIRLSGLGTFGKKTPKLLYADVVPNAALNRLQARVKSAMQKAGLQPSSRKFRPHVTIARFRHRLDPGELASLAGFIETRAGFRSDPFPVPAFGLYQSTLRPGAAPVHEALALYPLTELGPS